MPTCNQSQNVRAIVTAGSALAAGQLARDLSTDPSLRVTVATNPATLWRQIDTNRPAIILLDTRISGDQTPQLVRDLIDRANLPVLIRTDASENPPAQLLDCIEAGALGILHKPNAADQITQAIPSLIWGLKAAAAAAIANLATLRSIDWSPANATQSASILAIGAGMGGAMVLGKVLAQLPQNAPPAAVIVPLPARLIPAWADRLNQRCKLHVKPACNGETLQSGQVLVAPGDGHLLLRRAGSDWTVQLKDGPAVFHQRPSIEMLFNSIADSAAPKAVGVLLSGAGVDGIAGLLKLRKAGGRTLTESTGLFPDLPTAAMQCGAAETNAPAQQLAAKMLELAAAQQMPKAA